MPLIIITKRRGITLEERILGYIGNSRYTAVEIAQKLNRPVSAVNICLGNLKSLKRVRRDKNNRWFSDGFT